VVSVCRHPRNSNSIVVADLSQDVEPLLSWSAERIREGLFTRGAAVRPPLKEIRVNRCPFVAELGVLTAENWSRLGFDPKQIKERQRRVAAPAIAKKVAQAFAGQAPEPAPDVDAALYEGFLQDEDRRRCDTFASELSDGKWLDLDYVDPRLAGLARRLKARSFPQLLTPAEQEQWREFVSGKLGQVDAPWLSLAGFRTRLDALQLQVNGEAECAEQARRADLLLTLRGHGDLLARRYDLADARDA